LKYFRGNIEAFMTVLHNFTAASSTKIGSKRMIQRYSYTTAAQQLCSK
jgi:hypothetical protein